VVLTQRNLKMIESPTISLCMIIKNEEDFLSRCFDGVRGLVDEIIVVDTGSTDRSLEICGAYEAKVFTHPWVDDFSKVRNFSLQQAVCDWILVLDADEIIDISDHSKIKALIKKQKNCYQLTQRHYTDDVRLSGFTPCVGQFPQFEENHAGYFESALGRLFPNYLGIHYRGAVHELVEFCIEEMPDVHIFDPRLVIHHYGHTSKVKDKKDKSKLYTPLGEKKVNLENRGWKEWFELAVEHNNNQRTTESIAAFRESIKLNDKYLFSWINFGYVLCEAQKYDESREALLKALKLDPRSEEAFCNLGVVELRTKNYTQAEKYFRNAVRIKPNYVNALRNLSIALSSMERFSEAALVLHRILDLIPNDKQTSISLGSIYLHTGNSIEALSYFSRVYEKSPQNSNIAYLISQSIKQAGDAAESLRFLAMHLESRREKMNKNELEEIVKLIDRESVDFFVS